MWIFKEFKLGISDGTHYKTNPQQDTIHKESSFGWGHDTPILILVPQERRGLQI